jgi:hypothetical protein
MCYFPRGAEAGGSLSFKALSRVCPPIKAACCLVSTGTTGLAGPFGRNGTTLLADAGGQGGQRNITGQHAHCVPAIGSQDNDFVGEGLMGTGRVVIFSPHQGKSRSELDIDRGRFLVNSRQIKPINLLITN